MSKPWGRLFQIMCASQKVWTLSLECGIRKYSMYICNSNNINRWKPLCGTRSPQNSQHCKLICLTIQGHTVLKSLQKEDLNFDLSAVLRFLKSSYNWKAKLTIFINQVFTIFRIKQLIFFLSLLIFLKISPLWRLPSSPIQDKTKE